MNNANPWSKFFWNDWECDPALRLCPLAAQGLWMRLLCIAAKSSPTGFVAIAGRPCASTDIARLTGVSEQEVESLLGELSRNGVFSRDAQGRIYCRRMVRDNRKRAKQRQNGAKGGQSSYLNGKGIFSPPEQTPERPPEQPSEPQKPESIFHLPDKSPPKGPPTVLSPPPKAKPKAEVIALSSDWALPDAWREIAQNRGWGLAAIDRQAVKFKQYFGFGKGVGTKRSEKGWGQSWLNWLDRELKRNPDAATFGKEDDPAASAFVSASAVPEAIRVRLRTQFLFSDNYIQRWFSACIFDLERGLIFAPTNFHADYLRNNCAESINRALGREMKIIVRKMPAETAS